MIGDEMTFFLMGLMFGALLGATAIALVAMGSER